MSSWDTPRERETLGPLTAGRSRPRVHVPARVLVLLLAAGFAVGVLAGFWAWVVAARQLGMLP